MNPVRRVVTGHDTSGLAVITQDGPLPKVVLPQIPGTIFHEIWATSGTPARST